MTINFFEKGNGFLFLRELYGLNDIDVDWMQKNLFDYKNEPPTIEKIEENKRWMRKIGESEETIDQATKTMLDLNGYQRSRRPGAMQLFTDRFGTINMKDVFFTLRHIASVVDHGSSIRNKGLLKLTDLLMEDSPLKLFLEENGITFDIPRKLIRINGELHSLSENRFNEVRSKLYHFKGEIEAFISGDINHQKNYSCIQTAPEILWSLDKELFGDEARLRKKWKEQRINLISVEFDMTPDEFAFSQYPDADNEILNNIVINMCLDSMCKQMDLPEKCVFLHGTVSPGRLRIIEL